MEPLEHAPLIYANRAERISWLGCALGAGWPIIRDLQVVLRDRARYPHPLPAVAQGNLSLAVLRS